MAGFGFDRSAGFARRDRGRNQLPAPGLKRVDGSSNTAADSVFPRRTLQHLTRRQMLASAHHT